MISYLAFVNNYREKKIPIAQKQKQNHTKLSTDRCHNIKTIRT